MPPTTAPADRLRELLAPVIAALGSELEDVSMSKAGKRSVVRVLVDREGGIDLDQVAEASRVAGEALDALDEQDPSVLGPSYVLEVSSPGVDRPLTEPRHWRRNLGRLVTATLADGSAVTGRLTAADDSSVTLDGTGGLQVLARDALVRGLVQVEFNRKDAQDALDDEPEDEPA